MEVVSAFPCKGKEEAYLLQLRRVHRHIIFLFGVCVFDVPGNKEPDN